MFLNNSPICRVHNPHRFALIFTYPVTTSKTQKRQILAFLFFAQQFLLLFFPNRFQSYWFSKSWLRGECIQEQRKIKGLMYECIQELRGECIFWLSASGLTPKELKIVPINLSRRADSQPHIICSMTMTRKNIMKLSLHPNSPKKTKTSGRKSKIVNPWNAVAQIDNFLFFAYCVSNT